MDNFDVPIPDDLSQAADGLTSGLNDQVDAVAGGVEQLSNIGDIASQAIDNGINGAESAIDSLTSGLDDFLSKF